MENDIKRVIFKAPGMVFFRRCFAVTKVTTNEKNYVVKHGIVRSITTVIPIDGTIIRFIHK